MDANILVILNDNDMSISPNVGALKNYLTRLMTGPTMTSVRKGTKKALDVVPPVRDYARRWEEHLKGMVLPSTFFEEMGFYYAGPIDGHDIDTLVKTLTNLKEIDGPRFLLPKKVKALNQPRVHRSNIMVLPPSTLPPA